MRDVEKVGGSVSSNLDTRLLRFRSNANSEPLAPLASALLTEGRAVEAIEVLTVGLSKHPDDGPLLLLEGQAWTRQGDLIRAQAALLKAARVMPQNKEPFRTLGDVLLKRGDPDRAAKVLERALAIDANDRESRMLHDRATRLSRIAAHGGDEEEEQATTVSARALSADDLGPSRLGMDDEVPTAVVQVDATGRVSFPGSTDPIAHVPPPTSADGTRSIRARKATALGVAPPPSPSSHDGFGPDPFGDATTNAFPQDFARPPPGPPPRVMAPPPGLLAAPPPPAPAPARRLAPEPRAYVPSPIADEEPLDVAVGRGLSDINDAQPAPDVVGGAMAGQPENVDTILQMLEQQGIFEAPTGSAAAWAEKKEARTMRVGTRIGPTLGVVGGLIVALAVGGYFGWNYWLEMRHKEAAALVATAAEKALAGDHEDLVDAERFLFQARELDPHDLEGPGIMLFVHAQRALEDGTFEPGYLRPSIDRAINAHASQSRIDAALAVFAAGGGMMESESGDQASCDARQPYARGCVAAALASGGDDPAVLYIAGRIEQRLGDDAALEHLEAAVEREPKLVAAAMALAEARADEGQPDRALELVDSILAQDSDHLRAKLWRRFLSADEIDPAQGLAEIEESAERIRTHGAATDAVLASLTRARLLRRTGGAEAATEAVDGATQAGATDPRLLALVASEAQSVGLLSRAQTAATDAVRGAPSNTEFRKLLASILIDRRDGVRALRTLGALSAEDPDVLRMSARAALVVGGADTLNATALALDAYLEANPDEPNVDIKALRIRTAVALGQARDVLGQARDLARDAPGDPEASLALGEAALEARDARLAVEALERMTQASPDNADGHFLLGRARRLSGDAEEAERSLRRAIELLPSHVDAQLALGRLLVDVGQFENADTLYQELARQSGVVNGTPVALYGRLGRVEALLGLGRVDDASVQMENVRGEDRERAVARLATAQLAIAKGRPGEAVAALRPLADRENASPEVVALFGDALFGAGETEAAAAQYERALDSDSTSPEGLLGKAQLALRAEKPRDALEALASAERSLTSRIRPPTLRGRLLVLRGQAFLQEGRDSRTMAREVLRAAAEVPGVPAEVQFFLGEALSGENAPEARAAYQRYLELAPEGAYAVRARRAIR